MKVVRITDRETGEVIKQLPPQELVEGDIRMKKIVGLFVDDQA